MKTRTSGESSSAVGAICAVAAAVVFSTAGLMVRRVDLPAWDVSFWRSALMIVTILPLLIWRRREVWIDARNAGGAFFASAFSLAGSMIAFILALGLAPVANVLIMFGATPFITALLARLVLGEPLHRHTLIAMAVATTGLTLSVVGSLAAGAVAGMAVAFIVVLCISANYVVVRRHRHVSMTPALLLAGVIAALASAPFAHPATARAADFPWLIALGPGQLAGGLLLYMAALKRIPAGRAALLGLLELVLGPIWVWAIDGEKPGDLTLLGGAIVIGSAAANVWLDSRQPTG
jgi:drug/metabolite transporter (DMT)-like permease